MTATLLYRALLRRQTPWPRARNHQSRRRAQHQLRSQSTKGPPGQPASQENKATPRVTEEIPVPNTITTLPLWQRLGPLTRAAEGYARAQRKRPYWTQF